MFRKFLITLTMLLALPAFANAWYVSAKVQTAGQGTISPSGSTYYAAGVSSGTYTVTPATGYTISRVTLNGVNATPVTNIGGVQTFTVPYVAGKSYQYLVAYFTAPTVNISISRVLSTPGGGIREDTNESLTNIPAGSARQLLVIANPGYTISTVTAPGANSITGDSYLKTVVFNNLQASTTVTASFAATTTVTANAGADITVSGAPGSGQLNAYGASTAGASTFVWEANGAQGAFLTFSSAAYSKGSPATGSGTQGLGFVPAGTITTTVKVGAGAPFGVYSANLKVTSNAVTSTDKVMVTVVSQAVAQSNLCATCHRGQTSFNTYTASLATAGSYIATNQLGCEGCHTAQPHNNVSCGKCHGQADHNFGAVKPTVITATFDATCSDCHEANATTQQHNAAIKTAKASCVACHNVAIKHAGSSATNDGVRNIMQEFGKWSHHVSGVELQDAHCAACHLEGKVSGGAIVIDSTKHMKDGKVYLRNADTDTAYAWDPENPDHTLMDNFCMSCHDEDGATSTQSAAVRAVIVPASGKTASALNPFGDTISNRYDKMERPRVVDAKGQFATGNASHHAVRGQKYTKRTRVINAADPRAMTAAEVATFTANSSAVMVGARSTIYDAKAIRTASATGNPAYNVSKFEANYRTLTGPPTATSDTTLGDDSLLHCGDCHTVGQWKAAAGYNMKGAATLPAIGAHGSNNEYMLRNALGTDQRHMGQTYSSASGVNYFKNTTTEPWLVCFNCHSYQAYGSIGNSTGAAGTNHAGEYANSNRCNGPVNTISFVGYTTSINDTAEPYAFRLGLGQNDRIVTGVTGTSDTDFSNLFGIQCINCHNSGPAEAFGGIHGSKVNVYTDANGAQQKPYRFLPGLGNTMYVPGSAAGVGSVSDLNWEVKVIGTYYDAGKTSVIDNGGCYTIVPETGADSANNAPYSVSPAFEQEIEEPAANTKIFGTWGGCDDHRGNAHGKAFATGTTTNYSTAGVPYGWTDPTGGTVPTGGAGVTRKVLRPVTY